MKTLMKFSLILVIAVTASANAENLALNKYAKSSPLLKYCSRAGFVLLKADDPVSKKMLEEKKKLVGVLAYQTGGLTDDEVVVVSIRSEADHTVAERDDERYDFTADFSFYALGKVEGQVRVFVYNYGTQGPPSMRELK